VASSVIGDDGSLNVFCQDARLAFFNPGNRLGQDAGDPLPDPCESFSCGDRGQCVSLNLAPACVCEQGLVAVGSLGPEGEPTTRCVEPPEPVPAQFYSASLPALAADRPTPLTEAPETGPGPDRTVAGGCSLAPGLSRRAGAAVGWVLMGLGLSAVWRRRSRPAREAAQGLRVFS
jgi:hypothetical protein